MKKVIYILCTISLIFSLSSCEDMLEVDSSRYQTPDENELSSSRDSVSSVLGILRGIQNIADRYVILGEMRADLMDVTSFTEATIRQLSEYNVEDDNPFADPRDYYDIINNCNFFISKTGDPKNPLRKENALVHTLRAWVYMQIVYNWGEAYYITDPILSFGDMKKDYPLYDIPQMIDALIQDLKPLVDEPYPNYGTIKSFTSGQLFIPVKLLLADLYLWRGSSQTDYEQAATYYSQIIDSRTIIATTPRLSWSLNSLINQTFDDRGYSDMWTSSMIASSDNYEQIIALQMSESKLEGKTTDIRSKILQFSISKRIDELWDMQNYVHLENSGFSELHYANGDLRKRGNIIGSISTVTADGESIKTDLLSKLYRMNHILLYRYGLVYLRYAEAVNRAGKPNTAFAVLKYGLNPETILDEERIPRDEISDMKDYIMIFNTAKYANSMGIHARGCGDAAYDDSFVIGAGDDIQQLNTKNDSIIWVEDAICTELALETSFEGNRFQDLVRIALRRNNNDFLAKKIAEKHTNENYDRVLNLLRVRDNWFLSTPKRN